MSGVHVNFDLEEGKAWRCPAGQAFGLVLNPVLRYLT